jgi:hypothetical protein
MSERVPPEVIESAVGRERHPTDHYGRARGGVFYVLHSAECLAAVEDLRKCEFSLAMDNGLEYEHWHEDGPFKLAIKDGKLVPA